MKKQTIKNFTCLLLALMLLLPADAFAEEAENTGAQSELNLENDSGIIECENCGRMLIQM